MPSLPCITQHTKDEAISLHPGFTVHNWVVSLGGSAHLGEHLLGEGLRDLEDLHVGASGLNALLGSLDELEWGQQRILQAAGEEEGQ